jgi:hypothetical protein
MESTTGALEKHPFVMLGVVHRDPEGKDLLRSWLCRIAPEVITLEFSTYGLEFRKVNGPRYLQLLEERLRDLGSEAGLCSEEVRSALRAFMGLPYEYEATSDYTRQHGLPLYLVDMDIFSYLRLRKTDELMSRENIGQLLNDNGTDQTNPEVALAELCLEGLVKAVPYTAEMGIRDAYMRDRISVLMKFHSDKRFLHVCGWQHLRDPHGLYDCLQPAKVFSHDKALCV